jgi:hypothetical protein
MRRTSVVALFVVVLAGCGGSGNSTVILHPTSPLEAGIYISLTAPSGLTKYLDQWAAKANSGFTVVSKPQGPQVCSYTGTITKAMTHDKVPASAASSMSKYVGHPFTLALYGPDSQNPATCKRIAAAISRGASHSV